MGLTWFNQQLGTTGVTGDHRKTAVPVASRHMNQRPGPVSSQISSKHHTKGPGRKASGPLWHYGIENVWDLKTKQNFSRCAAQSITHVTK